MSELVEIWERPPAGKYMIAGWRQWADAGAVSSGLPRYLIEHTHARKIGEIKPEAFYLFQLPGTHHLFRPMVKLKEGRREQIQQRPNEFYYSGDDRSGFFIFLGEEPCLNIEQYAEAFFDAAEQLGLKRIAAVAGVYGPVPYHRDRNVSCVYSLPAMKDELAKYAVMFSNYEGGATISMYLAHLAEQRGMEFFRFCAIVPFYDFSKTSTLAQPIGIDEDFKGWYDVMRRLIYMFNLSIDLLDLEERRDKLIAAWDERMEQMARTMPELGMRSYMERVEKEFTEMPFEPLSDLWKEELKDLFEDEPPA